MKFIQDQTIITDILIIGSGTAGLRAAIECSKYGCDVVLVSERTVGYANNSAISGGLFAAGGIQKESGDSPEKHFEDTIKAGCFINDRSLVETITGGAVQQVIDLINLNINFRRVCGKILANKGPGHNFPRIVFTEPMRGVSITRPLRQHIINAGIRLMEGVVITTILQNDHLVKGALAIDIKGHIYIISAKSTILATGGAGEIYLRTNNATGSTGDGYVLGYEVGAILRDMEFVQFYPTTWGKRGSKLCSYEMLLPAGAILRNSSGEDILKKHKFDDLTKVTRDILSRTIMKEITEGRGIDDKVILDFTTISEEAPQRYYHHKMDNEGRSASIPVAPAAHFFIGGLKINKNAETGIEGLFAAGEVCGGTHGANRLVGNSIIETLVFGKIAAENAVTRALNMSAISPVSHEIQPGLDRLKELASLNGRETLDQLQQYLKQTMWEKAGILRNGAGLEYAINKILDIKHQFSSLSLTSYRDIIQAIKLSNMLTVSEIVCRAALYRTESRGTHYRTDYPAEDNKQWHKSIEISCYEGHMTLKDFPVNNS